MVPGSDGRMHQQLREVHRDVSPDGERLAHAKVKACVDGVCTEADAEEADDAATLEASPMVEPSTSEASNETSAKENAHKGESLKRESDSSADKPRKKLDEDKADDDDKAV